MFVVTPHLYCHLFYFYVFFFFFNDTATTEIYTLSLHDALPICPAGLRATARTLDRVTGPERHVRRCARELLYDGRSEEHTSELQSQSNLVCRLLLEKKKKKKKNKYKTTTNKQHK